MYLNLLSLAALLQPKHLDASLIETPLSAEAVLPAATFAFIDKLMLPDLQQLLHSSRTRAPSGPLVL